MARWAVIFAGVAAFATVTYAIIAAWQLFTMSGQLQEMQKQTNLTRQQLIGTQAAFVQVVVGIDSDLRTVEVGASNGGRVDATDIHIHVAMTQKDVLTGQAVGNPITICNDLYKPKLTGSPGFDSVLNQKYYPVDLLNDGELVVQKKRWIEMRSDYKYGDGFGKTITDSSCYAFIPSKANDQPLMRVQCDEAPVRIRE